MLYSFYARFLLDVKKIYEYKSSKLDKAVKSFEVKSCFVISYI